MNRNANPVRDASLAAALALAAALGAGLGLGVLGRAPDFAARLAAAEASAGRAEALVKAARGTPAAAGAICRGPAPEAARRLHDAIAAEAAQGGLTAETLEVTPGDGGPTLAPLQVRLSATGPYDAAVALLAGFARTRPEVFLDSVDLIPKVSNVTLSLSGRAFCAA
jgi:hypothetical protein